MATPAKVFATYELVEHILLYLPLRDLLLAQRINKAAFDVVSSSSQIHRALLWKPSAPPLKSCGADNYMGEEWRESEDAEPILAMINPFIAIDVLEGDDPHHVIRDNRLALINERTSRDFHAFRCARALPDAPHSKSSLDRMLLTHPPVGVLQVEYDGRPCSQRDIHVDLYSSGEDDEDNRSDSGGEELSDAGDYDANISDDGTLDDAVEDSNDDETVQSTVGKETGTTHGDLLQFGSLCWGGLYKRSLQDVQSGSTQLKSVPPAFCGLEQASDWEQLKRGVDEITGWEMLGLLDMSEWDRMDAMRTTMDP